MLQAYVSIIPDAQVGSYAFESTHVPPATSHGDRLNAKQQPVSDESQEYVLSFGVNPPKQKPGVIASQVPPALSHSFLLLLLQPTRIQRSADKLAPECIQESALRFPSVATNITSLQVSFLAPVRVLVCSLPAW